MLRHDPSLLLKPFGGLSSIQSWCSRHCYLATTKFVYVFLWLLPNFFSMYYRQQTQNVHIWVGHATFQAVNKLLFLFFSPFRIIPDLSAAEVCKSTWQSAPCSVYIVTVTRANNSSFIFKLLFIKMQMFILWHMEGRFPLWGLPFFRFMDFWSCNTCWGCPDVQFFTTFCRPHLVSQWVVSFRQHAGQS